MGQILDAICKWLPIFFVITLLCLACFALCGCASYSKTGDWSPNGFNYTLSRDRETGELTDYFGLSWNLK